VLGTSSCWAWLAKGHLANRLDPPIPPLLAFDSLLLDSVLLRLALVSLRLAFISLRSDSVSLLLAFV
jgi:hypothetical protein